MASLLSQSPLREVKLENCRLGDAAATAVVRAVREPMATLNLNRCDVGKSGAAALGAMLARVKTLATLDVSWNSGTLGRLELNGGFAAILLQLNPRQQQVSFQRLLRTIYNL